MERATTEAKRLAIAAIAGLLAYQLVGTLPKTGELSVDPILLMILRYVALAVAALLSYQVAQRFFRTSPSSSRTEDEPSKTASASLNGWNQLERRIVAWFRSQLGEQTLSPSNAARTLIRRLDLEDVASEDVTASWSSDPDSAPTK